MGYNKLGRSDLHEYQKVAVDHVMENKKSGLFLEMGLGKTVVTLTAINQLLYEDFEASNALVVGPKRVIESVWQAEAAKWAHLDHLTMIQVVGTPAQREKALKQNADIHLISRDNFAWLCALYGGSMMPFDILILDELSSFKNPKSVRFKSLRGVRKGFSRIIGLTGTPAPNGLVDLWAQIYALDGGERLGKYITHFREKYFRPGARRGATVFNYLIRKGCKEEIYKRIGDICLSMSSEDYTDLPEMKVNDIILKFNSTLQKKYDDFEEDKVMGLIEGQDEADMLTAANAAGLANKLLQFANGAVYDEDKNWHEIHKLKIEALKEVIESAGGKPVLVAYAYKHDLERIMKALKKYKPVKLETDKHIQEWNAGEIPILVMHPASGGHGLNLQTGGNTIVWFGLTWSLELYQQFNARLYRQGQKGSVVIHRLVSSSTMDERVIKSLEGKDQTQNDLMDAVKAVIDKYKNNFQ